MNENIEKVLISAIENLAETHPKMVEAVAKNNFFITTVDMWEDKYAIIINCDRRLNMNMSWRMFQDISMQLYDQFAFVKKWYKC